MSRTQYQRDYYKRHRKSTALTRADKIDLIRGALTEPKTTRELSESLGVSYHTVRNWIDVATEHLPIWEEDIPWRLNRYVKLYGML